MEFTYKLTEPEYLFASKIATKGLRQPWARLVRYAYLSVIFLIVWGSVLVGMLLEQQDLVGITAGEIQFMHKAQAVIPASFVPAIGCYCLVLILLRFRFLQWFDRKRRLEDFRTDPGCQAETTATVTPQSIAFRSATGSSESIWACYSTWAERNGILLLVTHAGVRKILKVAGLSDPQRDELRAILTTALPKK